MSLDLLATMFHQDNEHHFQVVMGLPRDAKIYAIRLPDTSDKVIEFFVYSDTFPEVADKESPPYECIEATTLDCMHLDPARRSPLTGWREKLVAFIYKGR